MKSDIQTLLSALQTSKFYPHPVTAIELIETHISWVILTGPYAYKIKKPVDLGFLNFSSLQNRKKYCELELKLNRRLAPDIYRQVIPITGSYQSPVFSGKGEVVEYALQMIQFPQQAQMDKALLSGKLGVREMDLLAKKIAHFHTTIAVADETLSFGDLQHVHQPVLNCYQDILSRISDDQDIHRVETLQKWSCAEFERHKEFFITRKQQGYIRECHGDLHLRNIAIVDNDVIAFDCIEFSDDLRWNDVMSEIAFLVMDLNDHQQTALASRFLNRYLELTGDYQGLKIFRYYVVYRAIVRAMVSCIRFAQTELSAQEKADEYATFINYVALAEKTIADQSPLLMITYGLSGSGKTFVTQELLQAYPAIRIRSDVERKRLWGLEAQQRGTKEIKQGIYSAVSSEMTYQHLHKLARNLLQAGYTVIVDATFLQYFQREMFRKLAAELSVEFIILHCHAPLEIMQNRVLQREAQNHDASDANLSVLAYQQQHVDKFSEQEEKFVLAINTEHKTNGEWLVKKIASRL